jgi:hypothetical protein
MNTSMQRLTKVWEIDRTLSMPESVVYDPKRDVLYREQLLQRRPGVHFES